ncbi:hypothetical protein CCE29_05520 [Lacticaseibacillus rhamnosus]|nr:hypothetical protein B4583_14250 [Lacticaseibacillus rhamnosus]AXI95772.1 alpha-galactosidase [Lacticaseibacillus rhamnosus GG]ART95454.1 hypothetical protein CCE29_05520 [Lacticaseibacillus rhamnosus]AZZ24438.1 alpha-galactosidase [Lacticaseibacillus rhamnosus]MSC24924.1 alpha-galactosidase [Lacticaseibacillus rhamnosus]
MNRFGLPYARRVTLTITRSPAQKSACKDLSRNGQSPAVTSKATYTPTSERAGSRSHFGREVKVRDDLFDRS